MDFPRQLGRSFARFLFSFPNRNSTLYPKCVMVVSATSASTVRFSPPVEPFTCLLMCTYFYGFQAVAFAAVLALWCPADRVYRPTAEHLSEAPGKFVNIGGVNTHYRLEGSGPLVVLVHGLGGSSHAFEYIAKTVAAGGENGEGHTVLSFDYFGRGFTDATSENNDLEQLVGLLAQLLLKLSRETGGQTTRPFTLGMH
jgi:hypothetical protein